MQLTFWGAARTVTGSMHLVTVNGRQVLLDCGLYQGKRDEAYQRNRTLPFDASAIDAVVLSHAHTDHSGNLPTLTKHGFKGSIHCTSATRDLCAYMLLDSAHIQESDVTHVNKRRVKRGEKPFTPLYTRQDAMAALRRFTTVEYGIPFSPVPGMTVHFRDAGHILGAAIVVVDLEEDGRKVRLLFSGDIGRPEAPILRDPEIAEDADVLLMESTYGDRFHESSGESTEMLKAAMEDAVHQGGKLLIPSFALGRTQEIIYRMNQMWHDGRLPPMDVYVDSPLALNLTEVFRLHPECYDEEMYQTLINDPDGDPLGWRRMRFTRSVDDSKRLNTLPGAAAIISASGMCEAGRILHHLANNVEDRRTIILFVGFQAEFTLGRRILDGERPIRIFGDEYNPRAQVRVINGYSAHADRRELLDWAARVQAAGNVKRTYLVHGELPAMEALAEGLKKQHMADVVIPERGTTVAL